MRRLSVLASAVAVSGLLLSALPVTSAFAAHRSAVLTVGRTGGASVRVGAILQGSLKKGSSATFLVTRSKGITCRSVTFKDKVTKNPTRPGTATELLVAQIFKKCSVSPGLGARSVKKVELLKLPYKTTIKDSRGNPVTVSGTQAKLTLLSTLGLTLFCIYAANKSTTKGNASNTDQSITFKAQSFHLVHGPPHACPARGSFSATFAPVRDTSVRGSPRVFVN